MLKILFVGLAILWILFVGMLWLGFTSHERWVVAIGIFSLFVFIVTIGKAHAAEKKGRRITDDITVG